MATGSRHDQTLAHRGDLRVVRPETTSAEDLTMAPVEIYSAGSIVVAEAGARLPVNKAMVRGTRPWRLIQAA